MDASGKPDVVVLGAEGQLGSEICRLLPEESFLRKNRDTLDITNAAAVSMFLTSVRPKFVINCAATNNTLDRYSSADKHNAVNNRAVAHLVKACALNNCHLVHISDAEVFGDMTSGRRLGEFDPARPLSKYASSKLLGEHAILSVAQFPDAVVKRLKYWIIRTSFLIGRKSRGSLMDEWANVLCHSRTRLQLPGNVVRSVTYAPHLARQIVWLLNNYGDVPSGVYHIANTGAASLKEMMECFLRFATDLKSSAGIEAGDYREFVAAYPELSATNASLNCEYWQEYSKEPLPSWSEGVREYTKQFLRKRNS